MLVFERAPGMHSGLSKSRVGQGYLEGGAGDLRADH